MLRKLFAVVSGACCIDNPDSPQHQEALLPGSLYGMIIKERLEEALTNFARGITIDVQRDDPSVDFFDSKSISFPLYSYYLTYLSSAERYIKKVLARTNYDIGSKMSNFLATGNLVSPSGLDW